MAVNEVVSAHLAAQAGRAKTSRGKFLLSQLGRMRFQIAIGLAFAVLAPAMLRSAFEGKPGQIEPYDETMLASVWSFLFGFLIFRKVTAFPGVRATAYILPAFLVAYAITVVGFFSLRLDYSRLQLGSSFLLTTAFFYIVFFLVRRAKRPDMMLVRVGEVDRIQRIDLVDWTPISDPADGQGSVPVVVDLKADLSPDWERFIADCALSGRPVYNSKQILESLTGRVQIEHLSENRLGSLLPDTIYGSAKRYFDFLTAVVVLVITWPFLLLIAIAIRIDSRGSSIFRQARIGSGGRIFTVYKFRTMRTPAFGAEDLQEQMTRANDPRITRLGRFLRKSRIDELPQIFNILTGHMSWIGPRPEAHQLSEWYESKIPFYRYRHIVRPGITGWAQVNQGHVTSLEDADIKLQYDFFYVKNFSLWLDILVLLRTLRVIFTGRGAK